MKVGDKVQHVLMGWVGIVCYDLHDNFLTSQEWGVKFKVDDKLKETHVMEAEIEQYKEGE